MAFVSLLFPSLASAPLKFLQRIPKSHPCRANSPSLPVFQIQLVVGLGRACHGEVAMGYVATSFRRDLATECMDTGGQVLDLHCNLVRGLQRCHLVRGRLCLRQERRQLLHAVVATGVSLDNGERFEFRSLSARRPGNASLEGR